MDLLKIDHESPVPLHSQVEALLRELIEKDDYKNGKLLPNEVELSKQLNISRNTLRQAINKLVFEGALVRKRGYGTTVAKKGVLCGAKNWLSFSQEMKSLGITPRNFELFVGFKAPESKVYDFLKADESKKILCLERLRGDSQHPFVFFISYFNPKIGMTGNENFSRPLYEILEMDYGVVVKTSKEEVSARSANPMLAEKLEISASDPILVRKRFVYDTNGNPVEYNIGYYRADSFVYTIESERE